MPLSLCHILSHLSSEKHIGLTLEVSGDICDLLHRYNGWFFLSVTWKRIGQSNVNEGVGTNSNSCIQITGKTYLDSGEFTQDHIPLHQK